MTTPDSAQFVKFQDIFSKHSDVQAVYLFGSHARGTAREDSDIDLGVVSTISNANKRMKLLTDMTEAGVDNVDLVLLNSAPPLLKYAAVQPNFLIYTTDDFDSPSYITRAFKEYTDISRMLTVHREALKARLQGA